MESYHSSMSHLAQAPLLFCVDASRCDKIGGTIPNADKRLIIEVTTYNPSHHPFFSACHEPKSLLFGGLLLACLPALFIIFDQLVAQTVPLHRHTSCFTQASPRQTSYACSVAFHRPHSLVLRLFAFKVTEIIEIKPWFLLHLCTSIQTLCEAVVIVVYTLLVRLKCPLQQSYTLLRCKTLKLQSLHTYFCHCLYAL